MAVRVQTQDFDLGAEAEALGAGGAAGAFLPADYFLFASSRSLASLITVSATFFGQVA